MTIACVCVPDDFSSNNRTSGTPEFEQPKAAAAEKMHRLRHTVDMTHLVTRSNEWITRGDAQITPPCHLQV
jgi:hypothetical protein